ncbi:type IV pili methyl-accepting chemotaxis transducer N-terminal domain-containing protein [Oceanibium sediminis]|uniref:type IV pili methyl-accepting chemotaxis transducer N-terminal domain-containing protein n=1 Tax=Oceanibium sediminis TaxID=2026339 RepID=UPI000DD4DDF0|nr:type IV pili methyl-accepting chemotaxis transducer N-terminal domain-containing protein [Oceanibium sediminis]
MPGFTPLRRRAALKLVAAMPFALLAPLPALARAADADARRKINLAGGQAMLTQRMTRGALFAAVDVDAARHFRMMVTSAGLFSRTLRGLKSGDAELGLPVEGNPAVLESIAAVEEVWTIFSPILDAIEAAGRVSDTDIAMIAQLNLKALERCDATVTALVSEYAHKDIELGVAVSLSIAGRQRMLSQQMAKDAALLALGVEAEKTRSTLEKTAALFEASLGALIEGLPAVSLPPAPGNVRAKLLEAEEIWAAYGRAIRTVAQAGFASGFDLTAIATQADPMLARLDEVVTLYEQS